jgi:hypothetical protein
MEASFEMRLPGPHRHEFEPGLSDPQLAQAGRSAPRTPAPADCGSALVGSESPRSTQSRSQPHSRPPRSRSHIRGWSRLANHTSRLEAASRLVRGVTGARAAPSASRPGPAYRPSAGSHPPAHHRCLTHWQGPALTGSGACFPLFRSTFGLSMKRHSMDGTTLHGQHAGGIMATARNKGDIHDDPALPAEETNIGAWS